MRRKSMPVLSVPGALVGGDEVSMAVFHELSRAEGPSQQTGLTANFRQSAPEIRVSLVSPRLGWVAKRTQFPGFPFRENRLRRSPHRVGAAGGESGGGPVPPGGCRRGARFRR